MDSANGRANGNLLSALGLTAVVGLTIFLALFLAQTDGRLGRQAFAPAIPSDAPPTEGEPVGTAVTIIITPPESSGPTRPAISVGTVTPVSELPMPTPAASPECARIIPAGWTAYTVRFGDTLNLLSLHSSASVLDIMEVNCLSDTTIYWGTRLYLPPVRHPVVCERQPPSLWTRYLVQRGDTLYSLATAHGVTVTQVSSANCLPNTRIQAGQQIFLPPLPMTATPPPTQPPPPPPTHTPAPPTATATAAPMPTATATTAPPTSTPTATVAPPTDTPTATAVPPTDTPTPTAAPPTDTPTFTPEPPTPTPIVEPPTATPTSEPTPGN